MYSEIKFSGIFKDIIPKYVEYKRAQGFEIGQSYLIMLRAMDNFFTAKYSIKNIILTKDMVLNFVKKRDNEASSTTCFRCSLIREFAIFLQLQGYSNIYFLPNEYIPKRTTAFTPFIFSHKQIKQLFSIIDNYKFGSNYLNTHKVYSTLVRLLYGCGLRISEALSLKISDIDFTNNIIHVFHSKNNVSRIVCISNSLSNVLKSYITSLNISEVWLFPSPKGRSLLSRYYTRFF